MKWINFTIVEIHGDEQTHQVSVQRIEDVPINVDHIFMVVPAMIPSTLAGPGGQPVGTLASRIISSGGAGVIVEGVPKKIIARIKDDAHIDVTAKDAVWAEDEESKIPKDNADSNDNAGSRVIKFPER
jgi:hypothetical protein